MAHRPYAPGRVRAHLTDALVEHGAEGLKSLRAIRLEGWQENHLDDYFENQRSVADNSGPGLNRIWFNRMKMVFEEIDAQTKCIPRIGPLRFLDLGCCPGGFTSYILNNNIVATGLGISLEIEKGGHQYLVEDYCRPRFDILYADLTYYQLGPTKINNKQFRPIPFDIRRKIFDVVILDGHHLRTNHSANPWDVDRLLVSQVIQAVRSGGALVIKLSKLESVDTAAWLYMLDKLSLSLTAFKPRTLHATRGTFYAIAQGVGQGVGAEKLADILNNLKKLWADLTFGGNEGRGRFMSDSDLDFLIEMDELLQDTNLSWLMELGRNVWATQEQTLHNFQVSQRRKRRNVASDHSGGLKEIQSGKT